MFDSLRRWVGQERDPRGVALRAPLAMTAARAPSFDADLLSTLHGDHRELIDRLAQIGRLAELGRVQELPKLLATFKVALQNHLIAKNVRFYNYVESSLAADEDSLRTIRSFRREMNAIAGGLMEFLKKYLNRQFDESTRLAFLSDHPIMFRQLAQRVRREETSMFPLYQAGKQG